MKSHCHAYSKTDTRVLGFLIRYFSNYYTLHRSDLAAPLDPRLVMLIAKPTQSYWNL